MRIESLVIALAAWASLPPAHAEVWNQFRGPNATGAVAETQPLPAEVGPDKQVIWKTPLPPGHSSPVLDDERIYLTAVEGEKLYTIALDRKTGKELWRSSAPATTLEKVHRTGSPAQSSPVTDGDVVISFFGSCGLIAYDAKTGEQRWFVPMGPFKNAFGAGSSPILVGDRVILSQDHDTDSFVTAIDKRTGKTLWRTDRSEFPRSYSTPIIWQTPDGPQLVVAGTLRAIGYDIETGAELWTVRGISRIVNMTPTAAPDGMLYLPAWSPGADENDRLALPPFDEALTSNDKNGDGTLSEEETPAGEMRQRFDQIDRDKSGQIDRAEYEGMRRIFSEANNVLLAIKPGGRGDITETHVLWKQSRQLPYVPSPVYADGYLYMVKNAGIFSAIDAATGTIGKSGRMAGKSSYYASPVYGDGKIYAVDDQGVLTVVEAGPQWKVLSTADFAEPVHATPALSGGRIYLRTEGHLYCFGDE